MGTAPIPTSSLARRGHRFVRAQERAAGSTWSIPGARPGFPRDVRGRERSV